MTSIRMPGLLGLQVGLALVLTMATALGHGRPNKRNLDELTISDSKGSFGFVVRDGDRFVALRIRKGENKLGYLHNFNGDSVLPEVDGRYLGYDLRGKNKNVLVREARGRDIRDIEWEFVRGERRDSFRGRFRAKNGELKGWWIGLGALEQAKKGSKLPRDQYPRARLILVKEKKDAAGFDFSLDPPDDGR